MASGQGGPTGLTILAIAMHGLSNDSVRVGGFVFGESLRAYVISEINLLIPPAAAAALLGARYPRPTRPQAADVGNPES